MSALKTLEQECLRPLPVMVLPRLMRNLATKLAFTVGTFLKEISIKDISERVILSSQNPAVARIKPIRGLFNQSYKSELTAGSSQDLQQRYSKNACYVDTQYLSG
jgi:hypothetical protein